MHAVRVPGWPGASRYEFLADSIWSDFAYGRNAVYPHRIYVRNALVHRPVVLRRKPWSHLSNHAPLAVEIIV